MFVFLVAVVIAFIICYAPFHVQRLITSRLNVSHLSLIQQRAITVFLFYKWNFLLFWFNSKSNILSFIFSEISFSMYSYNEKNNSL